MFLMPITTFTKIQHRFEQIPLFGFFKKVLSSWKKDNAPVLGAALAFYVIISLPALLLAVIGVAGIFVQESSVRQSLFAFIQNILGEKSREVAASIIDISSSRKEDTLRAVLGASLLFLSVTNVFGQLQSALNKIYKVELRSKLAIGRTVLKRILTFGSFLIITGIFGSSIILSGVISKADRLFSVLQGGAWIGVFIIQNIASLIIFTFLFTVIFRILPDGKIQISEVVRGAFITAVLFLVGEALLTIYFKNTSVASSYGATGSLVVLLLWIYYSAQIILLGAEITHLYATIYGHGIEPDRYAERQKN